MKTTTGLENPRTGLQGKFSIYHVLAVVLADGAALLPQFTNERVADKELLRLRELVHVHTDRPVQGLRRVVVTLWDGRTFERRIAHNLGTPDNPMTDRQVAEKFTALASPVLGHDRPNGLVEACWTLREVDDIRGCSSRPPPI